ncbi:hypothetical protein [Staphylococcus phage SA3]|uniref:Uncharacterized protein n=8 Tax=Kayvirus TaxID=1857843 RepID=A0A3Q9R5G1_9CAUD|nr:hypothetical protein F360_gp194 [Staphylococcus phage G15]YP_009099432.1 hypothetical protein P108_0095 [Staphylococcus phage P108]ARQ96166.1 hypothetical protein qdsa002_210 [Staphylococcus phage qdsa002]ASZ78115.1 hypothetical protein [Staphylococcus phage SA3]AUG85618.1 hypothetical protein HSA30_gp114 [Staphylococcus phage HSA30]AXU40142.1 hypothetical protein VBSavMJYL01_140 [Staphylococcus phage VB_SavM_JYL01]AZU97548.1 hypothetical protein VBSavMJYL02_136 [Staphylococcus phage VB-Sa
MKAESIARFFQDKVLQIEGYKVRFTQASSSYILDIDTMDESVLFLDTVVFTLSGKYLLDTHITINKPETLSSKELYTEIGNKLQEIVGDQTKTDIELTRYFKEVK